MSPEAQQIAIEQACGWTETEAWLDGRRCFEHADSNAGWDFDSLPDYLNDLNACREFEIWLLKNHPNLQTIYRRILIECVGSDGFYWMATAPQRCEAFLKTIGRWLFEPKRVNCKGCGGVVISRLCSCGTPHPWFSNNNNNNNNNNNKTA